MQKSLLSLYIQRVAAGDEAFVDRLISQLSERLLFIPIEEKASQGSEGCKVKITLIHEAYRTLVPAFSSEALFKEWCKTQNRSTDNIALLGADLSAALTTQSWLWINPGSESALELQPFMLQRLAQVAVEQQVSSDTSSGETELLETPEIMETALREPNYLSGISVTEQNVPLITESVSQHDQINNSAAETSPINSEQAPAAEEAPRKKKGSFLSYLRTT